MAFVVVQKEGKVLLRRLINEQPNQNTYRIRLGNLGQIHLKIGESKTIGAYQVSLYSDSAGTESPQNIRSVSVTKTQTLASGSGISSCPSIADFNIIGKIGEGGMGTVWRAIQLSTRRETAVKVLGNYHFAAEKERVRFEREVTIAAKLNHPNIARVYQSGLHQGVYYYAMEYIEGVHLDKYVQQNQLSHTEILKLICQISQAVGYAHEQGIIHRDLKPSNILVTREGHPYVVDFGLAKLTTLDSGDVSISIEGEIAGTPAYMAPEQAAGNIHKISTRTDVYSLGVLLYYLLTDQLPHNVEGSRYDVLSRIIQDEIQRPRKIDPSINRDVEAILMTALAKEPMHRYISATSFQLDIDNYLKGEPILAKVNGTTYYLVKKIKKHRLPVFIGVMVFLFIFSIILIAYTKIIQSNTRLQTIRGELEIQKQAAEMAKSETTSFKAQWNDLETMVLAGRNEKNIRTALLALKDDYLKTKDDYLKTKERIEGTPQETAAIQALAENYLEIFDPHKENSFEKLKSIFSDSCISFDWDGRILKGPKDIFANQIKTIKSTAANFDFDKIVKEPASIQVSGNNAFMIGQLTLHGQTRGKNEMVTAKQGYLLIFQKIQNKWLIASEYTGQPEITDRQTISLRPVWQDGKTGYIDPEAKMVIEPQFTSALDFSEGLAAFLLEDKWGFVNIQGKSVVPAQFSACSSFSEGFSAVELDGKWKFIDLQGNLASETAFEAARSFSEGLAAVKVDGKWGYLDRKMTMVIKPTFDDTWYFNEGLAPIKIGSKWGYINSTGQVTIEPQYYWVDAFSEGLAFVQGGIGNEGYIDKTGKLVIAGHFFDANPFSQGLAGVLIQAGETYGLIDRTGHVVIPPRFDTVGLFSEGLAPVRIQKPNESKCGYIDTKGTMVIEPNVMFCESFSSGLARAYGNGKSGYIDKTGKFVWVSPPSQEKSKPSKIVRQIKNPVMKVNLAGPEHVTPKEVIVIGNPFRQRFPDGMNWKDDKPSAFARNVWDMIVYEGRIYLGSGDYWNNAGPTDIYCFVPGQNQFTLDYTAPDEMISKFYIFEGKLVVPGNDPQENWDFGNIYIKEAGRWRKVRTIPNGLMCFEMAYAQGTLFARINTMHAPKLLASKDWGQTWKPVIFKDSPNTLFTWNGQLSTFDWNNNLCHYEKGILYSEKAVPKSVQLVKDTAFSWPGWRCAEAIPFAEGLILTSAKLVTNLDYGPFPLLYLKQNQMEASVIDIFKDGNVMDTYVSGETLYVLCTRPVEGAFENAIYSTKDVKTWRCEATFTTDSFTRSFVEVGGEFYVGIGCRGFTSDPLPNSTGNILRVIPTR